MKNVRIMSIALAFCTCSFLAFGQSKTEDMQVAISSQGDSVLKVSIGKRQIRVVVNTAHILIGEHQPPDKEQLTNCLYTRRPCSQVRNVGIWVGDKRLVVPRSVFADCTELNVMYISKADKMFELILSGGDGAESYSVRVYFDPDRILRREVYDGETDKLYETTTYMPPVVVN